MAKKTYKKVDTFQLITDRIIDLMENDTIPWRKPWKNLSSHTHDNNGMPRNIITGKHYKGANLILLGCAPYESNLWMTYNQAKKQGGNVKRGEKGWPVVYWKFFNKAETDENGNETGKIKRIPMLRHYTVFNLDQTENVKIPKKFNPEAIETPDETPEIEPIECCELVIDNMPNKPGITVKNGDRAFYRPSTDHVTVPELAQYINKEEYYSTMFHELVHATGHQSRLSRAGVTGGASFGSDNYSREELVAEIGGAMICGHCNIENVTIENSAAYLRGWIKQLKSDPKAFVIAAGQAEKAARYIMDIPEEKYEETDE